MAARRGAIDPVSTLNWQDVNSTPIRLPGINWDSLQQYAIQVRLSLSQNSSESPFSKCVLLPQYNLGGVHLVRIIEFDDGERWVARIQLHGGTDSRSKQLRHEVDALTYIRAHTSIPVPQIFAFESTASNPTGVAFFLMEFIPGNTAMDSFGGYDVHRGEIPAQYKTGFMQQVAKVQAEITSVRFSKIGRLVRADDGSYDIGPFPDLGGPFYTAAEYLKAWAQHAKFPKSESQLQKYLPKGLEKELGDSIRNFPSRLEEISGRISLRSGPFPLYHPDFRHSNMIIDTDYNILAVIDWENASTVPWELVEFPLFLSQVPPPMDLPENYDDNGVPKDPSARRQWQERDEYVRLTMEAEVEKGLDQNLSMILANRTMQNLAGALKLFLDPGKIGFYGRVLDQLAISTKGGSGL